MSGANGMARRLHRRLSRVYWLYMSRPATASQKLLAKTLNLKVTSQTARVLAAQILDAQEDQALAVAKKMKLAPGVKVAYFGKETPLRNKTLTIEKITERGFVFFKGTIQFARPHNLTRA